MPLIPRLLTSTSVIIVSLMYDVYRFPSLLPILDAEFVVDKIIAAIQTNQSALYTPKIVYLLIALKG